MIFVLKGRDELSVMDERAEELLSSGRRKHKGDKAAGDAQCL